MLPDYQITQFFANPQHALESTPANGALACSTAWEGSTGPGATPVATPRSCP